MPASACAPRCSASRLCICCGRWKIWAREMSSTASRWMTARVITRAWRSTACSVCVSIIAAAANNIAMADEDNEQEQDAPEPPPRLFTLKEAETACRELEPFLVEAMESRKKLA